MYLHSQMTCSTIRNIWNPIHKVDGHANLLNLQLRYLQWGLNDVTSLITLNRLSKAKAVAIIIYKYREFGIRPWWWWRKTLAISAWWWRYDLDGRQLTMMMSWWRHLWAELSLCWHGSFISLNTDTQSLLSERAPSVPTNRICLATQNIFLL